MSNGKLENLRSDINLLIKIWHTFIGSDAHNIYEKDIVKICKYLHLRNLYGCLLSTLYAVDTTMPDLHITDFNIKNVSGVYSNSRRIFTSALHIDHVKWTQMLNEMVFGHKFESKEM